MGIKFSCVNFYSKEPDKTFEFYKGIQGHWIKS